MAKSDAILRINQDPDGLDFASLRKEAIELVQQLSGKIWTDYNLHDPGVTILEQLCFGLTELAYQAGIGVEEYLSDQHGVINYRHYSLFKPHEILPNAALTPEDYCKLLVDAIPEIDAIHIGAAKHTPGIYDLRLKLIESLTAPPQSQEQKQEFQQKILARVRMVYQQNRNLGEDLGELIVEDAKPCFLKGVVETQGRRPRAEILADIFFQCARKISSDIRIERYEDAYSRQQDLAQLFTGPLTQHGYIHGQNALGLFKPIQELNGLITQIEGVKKVYDLELVDAEGNPLLADLERDHGFYLQLPQDEHQLDFLTLSYNPGKTEDARGLLHTHPEKSKKLLQDAKRYLQRLEFEYNAFRNNKSSAASFYPLPEGRARAELDYYSIQHHFPNVYGINAAGVPSAESPERKLQAKQLKAYLYPFEQLLANFQQQIQQLQMLFTLNESIEQSYFTRYLDNQQIPQIEPLYRYKSAARIQSVQKNYDDFTDRKNRALDTLLAIYGETFPDEALSHFNDYHQEDCAHWLIHSKIQYLKLLDRLTGDRAKAFNQAAPQWQTENISCFQQKLSILLGLANHNQAQSLTQIFQDFNVGLVADDLISATKDAVDIETQPLAALKPNQWQALKKWQYQRGKKLTLSTAMLRDGVYASNYRLHNDGEHTSVYLQQNQKLVLLKSFKQVNEANGYAHKFKKIIATINDQSEGFHLVEHLLLRPRLKSAEEPDPALQDNFFNFTLSLVFPAWTARFINPNFRQFVQSLVNENLPAHLLPRIYWLDYVGMQAFESLYQQWLNELQRLNQPGQQNFNAFNIAAAALVDWLKRQSPAAEYWV